VLDHTRAIPDFTAPEFLLDAAPLNAAGDRLYAGAVGFNPHLTGAPSDTTYQHALTRWLGGVKPREIHVPFGLEVKFAVYALPDYDNVKSKLNSHRIFVCGVALVTKFNSDVLAPEEDMAVSFCGCYEQACNIYFCKGSGYVMSVQFVIFCGIFVFLIRSFLYINQIIVCVGQAGVAYDPGYAHAAVNCHP